MIRSRQAGLVPAALLLLASAASSGAPAPRLRLLAVTPTSPWTLVELERSRVEIASYDPQTGVAYVIAGPAEEARLVDAGFRVATADPDLESGRRASFQISLPQYPQGMRTRKSLGAVFNSCAGVGSVGRTSSRSNQR